MTLPTTVPETFDDDVVDVAMVIDGRSRDARTGHRYSVVNPANGRLVGTASLASAGDAECAINSAAGALEAWRQISRSARADAVSAAIDAVERATAELAPLLTREQGKPLAEATAEVAGFVSRMRAFVRLASEARTERVLLSPSNRGDTYGSIAEPVVAVTVALTAWNYPVGLLAKKLGPILMAGGTVVVKPACTTPLATSRLVGLMNAAGLPKGVLNCVTGRSEDIGDMLTRHPAVARVHLTGSNETGRQVSRVGTTPSRELVLELGGSDPMIVCRDADLERALGAVIVGRYRNAGQVCTAVKRLYVDVDVHDSFVNELIGRVRLLQPGDGLVPAPPPFVRMGPAHTAAQRDCVEKQLQNALQRGATVLVGGRRPIDSSLQHGHFFEPTLVANVPADCKLVTEEVFGPVLPVFRTQSLDDAIAQVNMSPWDLGASIWTRDREAAARARSRIRCRRLWINRLAFGSDMNR